MRGTLTVAVLTTVTALDAFGQSATERDDALDSLAGVTAERIARYADRRVAVAAGYRPVGGDFPGMGEHWIHPGELLANRLDASRPTMLAYAMIDGAPRLLGAGYVISRRTGDRERSLPGWPHAWHEHSGLVGDESGVNPGVANDRGTRVWVLHIWTGLPNADGAYAPDNWALPFARLGLDAPPTLDADAGRAFSLVSGGDRFLKDVLADAGLLTPATVARTDSILGAAVRQARRVASALQSGRSPLATDADRLRAIWKELSVSLRELLGAGVEPYMAPPHPTSPGHHADHPR